MAKKVRIEEPVEETLPLEAGESIPIHPPLRLAMSGLYEWKLQLKPLPIPPPGPLPIPVHPMPPERTEIELAEASIIPTLFIRQELRLDVDGRYPLNMVSGTIYRNFKTPLQWIASLKATGSSQWAGTIWYKDPATASFPYTNVVIQVTRGFLLSSQKATVTFTGAGATATTLTFDFKSPYYHPVDFEFDYVEGITPDICYDTSTHPNRPTTLPLEKLTIDTIYRRAGFAVTTTAGAAVPLAGAGPNQLWSDAEMHDAMQTYWSHFVDAPEWAAWVFFAAQHEMGYNLGGIMFDDLGPNQRQGTSIFYNSFISQAPANDPNPAAWVERMRFWTAVHEMGHTFNLAHSWQKALPATWIPLVSDPAALSFMNYPYLYPNGQNGSEKLFFSNFQFRFSDQELLFMRHAPYRFVEQGYADWFDQHGFRKAEIALDPVFKLEVRINRDVPVLEFMEPLTLELKLTNVSTQPVVVPEDLLLGVEHMTVILKRDGRPARQFRPFAQYCRRSIQKTIMPGESMYESLFVSSGLNGWDIAEPGYYTVQLALHQEAGDIVSNPLRLRVTPPMGREEELLAQDFFSQDVGRIFTFDGSQALTRGNDVLAEVAAKLKDRKVTIHARVALGMALMREYKRLDFKKAIEPLTSAAQAKAVIACKPPRAEEARRELTTAFKEHTGAAETLGHIDFKYYMDRLTDFLADEGKTKEAVNLQQQLFQTLSTRRVVDRVLKEVRERCDKYEGKPIRPLKVAS